jgi:hypothetical protein
MTKQERKAAIRALIDAQRFDWPFSVYHVEEINRLTGWDFKGYKRVRNPTWKDDQRCLAHTDDGQTWVIWSWNKAVDGNSGFNDMLEAMRAAVQPQMRKFAVSASDTCAVCESTDFLSVDHKDTPFIVLARNFIKEHPGMLEAIANDATGEGWYIKDLEVLDSWLDFHGYNATYQVLCRSCNSKKGAKHGNQRLET